MKKILIGLLFVGNWFAHFSLFSATTENNTFSRWKQECYALPKNPKKFQTPLINNTTFVGTIFASISLFNSIYKSASWLHKKEWQDIKPFAQKLVVNSDSTLFFFGDLHGNIHDLLYLLSQLAEQKIINDNFKITKPNTYLIFLGDYVDRGFYGVEVLYTILRLKLANPDHVFMVRGNHEDIDLNKHYGFIEELKTKFGDPTKPSSSYDLITHFYAHLPSVIYVGCKTETGFDFIQCCHGGIEIGYNPHALLKSPENLTYERIDTYNRKEAIRSLPGFIKQNLVSVLPAVELEDAIPVLPTQPVHNGFMWHDFIVASDTDIIDYTAGRGWALGKPLTDELLKKYSSTHYTLRAVFRAHQHYGEMLTKLKENGGMVDLWNGTVFTFLSGAPSGTTFAQPNCGVLTLNHSYDYWKLSRLIFS